ncbi:MAG: DNA repair and recombination protein RadB, partial [Nanoarchaeota archaeon]
MAEHFISSGNEVLDELSGGIEKDVITTMYGPAGVGKSNFCILTAVDVVTKGGKVVYIDTDGSFSPERLRQVAEARGEDPKQVLENMVFFKPVNFQEQKVVFDKLKSLITDKIGLVVVDSIAMLYRLEMGRSSEDVYGINKELGRQLSYLSEIARKRKIPILVTNQVYSSFEEKDKVHMVGGDILRYSSKCLIELRAYRNVRKAILKRHRSQPEGKEALFRIIQEGVEKVDEEETRVSEEPEPQP